MTAPAFDHGPRISSREHIARIQDLYRETPDGPGFSRQAARTRERREFDINIDHRLGVNFPAERREALWQAREAVAPHRLGNLVRAAWTGVCLSIRYRHRLDLFAGLSARVVRKLRPLLSDAEIKAYLDLEDDTLARLL